MITESTPDARPNATETETSHSARVTCCGLIRPLSGDWLGKMGRVPLGIGAWSKPYGPRLAAADLLADFRL